MLQASFSVRSATRSDLAAIGSILSEWLIDPVTGQRLSADIEAHLQHIEAALSGAKPDAEFIVAESDQVVGVCGLQWTDIAPELVAPAKAAVEVVTAYVRDVDRGGVPGERCSMRSNEGLVTTDSRSSLSSADRATERRATPSGGGVTANLTAGTVTTSRLEPSESCGSATSTGAHKARATGLRTSTSRADTRLIVRLGHPWDGT